MAYFPPTMRVEFSITLYQVQNGYTLHSKPHGTATISIDCVPEMLDTINLDDVFRVVLDTAKTDLNREVNEEE